MHRPDAPVTPDTLDQHPLDRVVATHSAAGAAMCSGLAQDGTKSVVHPNKHAMQQPISMTTGTQVKQSTVPLTH